MVRSSAAPAAGSDRDARESVTVVTEGAEQTRDLGRALGSVARAGDRIALLGPLGAGKTQLAKGFALGLGVEETVNSPSFTLMAEYAGRLPLFHLDLYRLDGVQDVLSGGLLDERQAQGVTIIEWATRTGAELDAGRAQVSLEMRGGDRRALQISAPVPLRRYLEAARDWRPR